MRIDSAKTAKLNRLRSYEKQNELNYTNFNNDQVNTPSTAWPNNNWSLMISKQLIFFDIKKK